MDGLDLEEIVGSVAARAGHALADTERDPMYGKVRTAGDLVAFLSFQSFTPQW